MCYHGDLKRTYRVLGTDGYDLRVEFEDGRIGTIDHSWRPERGDRLIRHGGWAIWPTGASQ